VEFNKREKIKQLKATRLARRKLLTYNSTANFISSS